MAGLKRVYWGRYEICFPADTETPVEPSALIDSLGDARSLEKKGRGGIRITNIADKPVACRKYIHGGLFRGITGDIFFNRKRAINEFQIMLYLQERSFPIVSPYCVIIEERLLTKNLYILTHYKEDAGDLMEFLQRATQKERYRAIKRLAELMWQMEKLSVYHPDLHLSNVLVESKTRALLFLDFDRTGRKAISAGDMERMFWRLNRYADKMEREGRLIVGGKEKLFFLRAYGRLSGVDMVGRMAAKAARKSILSKLGWFFEGLFYRN
jgi:tRNA A-37 threonylcarbamoyl transferase component Bud32